MRVVLQRVTEASVTIDGQLFNEIQQGYLLLVGIVDGDNVDTVGKMAAKVHDLRIFEDENGKMNLSIEQIGGQVLSISQFTLYANCKKGNRPSFTEAGEPHRAEELYEYMVAKAREQVPVVETGVFGAEMEVSLVNDGPFTVILEDL